MPRNIDAYPFSQLSDTAFRVITAVEMLMKNHEGVDIRMIRQVSRAKISLPRLRDLIRTELVENKLLRFDNGDEFSRLYGLSQRGYDYLGLRKLCKSDQVTHLGNMIGTGKESVIYLALGGPMCGLENSNEDCELDDNESKKDESLTEVKSSQWADQEVIIKFHRLGHNSFKKAKSLRMYHARKNPDNWLYMARLAAQREYRVLQMLSSQKFPVPHSLGHNRNAVVMEYLRDYITLNKVKRDDVLPSLWITIYHEATSFAVRFAKLGLVHGDLNEFNLMLHLDCLNQDCNPECVKSWNHPFLMIIDFPQIISRDHKEESQMQYERDLYALHAFFVRRGVDLNLVTQPPSSLTDIERTGSMDVMLKLPGYINPKAQNDNSAECGSSENEDEEEVNDAGQLSPTNDDFTTNELEFKSNDPVSSLSVEKEENVDEEDETETSSCNSSNESLSNEEDTKSNSVTKSSRRKKAPRIPQEDYERKLAEKQKRRQMNENLQKNVTRQMRAVKKRKNRLMLKCELTF